MSLFFQVAASPEVCALACAELYLIILRAPQITIAVKRQAQRTATEQKEIDRGLLRSIFLDIFLFVPGSVTLMLVIAPLLFRGASPSIVMQRSIYGLLGIASYGFPFALIRQIVTRVALKTLAEFAAIAHKEHDVKSEAVRRTNA